MYRAELIERAKIGDQDAITQLYNRTYNNVYFTVKALVKSEDTILDIVQDSYVKGFSSLSQLQDPEKFRAWIKRIAHNKAIDHLRKTKPVMFSQISTDDEAVVEFKDDREEVLPDVVVDKQETTRLIKEILDSLSDEQRLVVGMFYYEKMTVKEIAAVLGVSENTVKSRLSYGRKKIEVQVLELEKKGTKLYSLAPLPFLMLLFRSENVQAAEIPNAHILQRIQRECIAISRQNMSAYGSADYTEPAVQQTVYNAQAANTAGAVRTAAAKTTAGAAGKGIAVKIIAGIAAAAVLGGAAFGIYSVAGRDKEEPKAPEAIVSEAAQESSDSELVKPHKIEVGKSSEEVYSGIIAEYANAMASAGPSGEGTEFPDVNQTMMNYFHQGSYGDSFYYIYLDMDSNGTDELLIGYGGEYKSVVDVYTMQDEKPVKLINDPSLGERSQLDIYKDGTMIMVGSGGADLHSVTVYRFQDDGVTLSEDTEYYEGAFDLESILAEKSGNQIPMNKNPLEGNYSGTIHLDWKPIVCDSAENTSADISDYVGRYMNGNGIEAGTIIIRNNDDGTLYFSLEAAGVNGLETVFEGTGYASGNGLSIEADGGIAEFVPSEGGFKFDADQELKDKWMIDPYVYEAEYSKMSSECLSDEGSVDITKYDGYSCLDEESLGFRLDTYDGNLVLTHIYKEPHGPNDIPVVEKSYTMDLDTAEISGNQYVCHDMYNSWGDDESYKFFGITYTFEEDRVVVYIDSDVRYFAGGASLCIEPGEYIFTK